MVLVHLFSRQIIQRFILDLKVYQSLYIKSLRQNSQTKRVLIGHFLSCMTCYTENKIIKKTCE